MSNLNLIVAQAQKGNRQAMEQLYCLTVRYLYAVCQRYITNEEDVKDIVQESYIRIFESLASFTMYSEASLRGWMARIVANAAVSFLRSRRIEFTSNEPLVELSDTDNEDDSLQQIEPEALHAMVRSLPDGYRTVLNLYVFEQKNHREIAQMLGISEGTSASQYLRAKRILKAMILKEKEESL